MKMIYIISLVLWLNFIFATSTSIDDLDDEFQLKCDSCLIISKRISLSFQEAEKDANVDILKEEDYVEAAESTCDEEWTGYGIENVDDVQHLAGPSSSVTLTTKAEEGNIWERRLQDFCDELLAESPDEKTLYQTWKKSPEDLDDYLCRGEKALGACSIKKYGNWPGDDFEDYDDLDFDYVHDEF